jgi:hypothetical protein
MLFHCLIQKKITTWLHVANICIPELNFPDTTQKNVVRKRRFVLFEIVEIFTHVENVNSLTKPVSKKNAPGTLFFFVHETINNKKEL